MTRFTIALFFAILAIATIAPAAPSENIDLSAYELAIGPLALEGVQDNASGMTYCRESKSLFCVLNAPTQLVELERDGSVKRRIRLAGFDDTEGVVSMGKGAFAVVEERRRKLVIFSLDDAATSVTYGACRQALIDATPAENKGLEGIAYNPKSKQFYILKEKQPRKIYRVEVKPEADEPEVETAWDVQKKALGLSDLSGLHFDPKTGHLLVLSHESRTIVETTLDGKEVSRLKLSAGSAGLTEAPAQPEGICLDDEGNLYICSEPNTFYVFKKK